METTMRLSSFVKAFPLSPNGTSKLCLSSRPWPVFDIAFRDLPTLRLQDLTFQGMVQFVVDNFRGDKGLRKMIQDEVLDSEKLVTDIVMRADRVIL